MAPARRRGSNIYSKLPSFKEHSLPATDEGAGHHMHINKENPSLGGIWVRGSELWIYIAYES